MPRPQRQRLLGLWRASHVVCRPLPGLGHVGAPSGAGLWFFIYGKPGLSPCVGSFRMCPVFQNVPVLPAWEDKKELGPRQPRGPASVGTVILRTRMPTSRTAARVLSPVAV